MFERDVLMFLQLFQFSSVWLTKCFEADSSESSWALPKFYHCCCCCCVWTHWMIKPFSVVNSRLLEPMYHFTLQSLTSLKEWWELKLTGTATWRLVGYGLWGKKKRNKAGSNTRIHNTTFKVNTYSNYCNDIVGWASFSSQQMAHIPLKSHMCFGIEPTGTCRDMRAGRSSSFQRTGQTPERLLCLAIRADGFQANN